MLKKIYITADHRKAGPDSGGSPGYGITLLAETTSGMRLFTFCYNIICRLHINNRENGRRWLYPRRFR